MRDLYPGYDVLSKWNTPSFNPKTRETLARRLRVGDDAPRFFHAEEWTTLNALCDCICPQSERRIPVAALVDEKMRSNDRDGFRSSSMPEMQDAWRIGLSALDHEARKRHGAPFARIEAGARETLVRDMSEGRLEGPDWRGMPSHAFFHERVLTDIVKAYYAHPAAWNEIGFGGPASPRGYVRMDFDMRDPWEAAEAKPGAEDKARKENARVDR
jgi:hypothetical protein